MDYLYTGACLQNKRQSNMDSLLLKYRIIDERKALLAVVCDGVGSLSEGAFASGMTVGRLGEWFSSMKSISRIGISMRDTALDINTHIVSKAKQKNIHTATTLSAILLIDNTYYAIHIGDSRIYCYDGKTVTPITRDDVSEAGKLTACIGQVDNVFIQYYEGVALGKTFLICSDGLYKRMDLEFLKSKMSLGDKCLLKETVENLVHYAILSGEQDNISLALIKIQG